MAFAPDGSLAGPGLAESRWRLEAGQLLLALPDGTATMRFRRVQALAGGETRLCGGAENGCDPLRTLFLGPPASGAPLRESRLNVSLSLAGETDTLLVVFNSAGRFSDGIETRWELFDLPIRLGLDHVRLAETRAPTVYYLDKVSRIMALLAGAIGPRTRDVVMAGMSSGGFASLLFAELLCARLPEVRFRTFTINPQTGYGAPHDAFIAANVPLGDGPDLLDARALSSSELAEPDIAAVVRRSGADRGRVRHRIFFDSGNAAERYYVGRVSGLPGFHPEPVPLGLNHMMSTIALFERGLLQAAVAEAVREPAPGPVA